MAFDARFSLLVAMLECLFVSVMPGVGKKLPMCVVPISLVILIGMTTPILSK